MEKPCEHHDAEVILEVYDFEFGVAPEANEGKIFETRVFDVFENVPLEVLVGILVNGMESGPNFPQER